MDLSVNASSFNNLDSKLNAQSKAIKLNPNAAEFVPFSLRSPAASSATTSTWGDCSGVAGKAKLDRSESSISNNSDDEAHQYWRCKLPDDITPDFKFVAGEESVRASTISLAGLSILEAADNSRISEYLGESARPNKHQGMSLHGVDGVSLGEMIKYGGPRSTESSPIASSRNLVASPWGKQFVNDGQNLTNGGGKGQFYSDDSGAYFPNDSAFGSAVPKNNEMIALEFLASQFPGFAAESLAEVYYANGCDLNLSIEMLTQLELQGSSGFNQNLSSNVLSAPNLSTLDFSAVPVADRENGLSKYAGRELQHTSNNTYQSSEKENFPLFKPSSTSGATFKATDFTSAVKLLPQDSGQWKFERKGSFDPSTGTNRQSHLLASPYGLHGRSSNENSTQTYGGSRVAPVWFETGEAVADLSSELREEAHDHARFRNAFFEQASQAYLIGNKAPAKDLGAKSQLHNMQMKAAYGRARDSIYQQRDPVPAQLQSYTRGQDPIIDLHGLYVNEAIDILKQELSVLRSTARSAGRRLQVLICVGMGHHTKGTRTAVRLPVAVESLLPGPLHSTFCQVRDMSCPMIARKASLPQCHKLLKPAFKQHLSLSSTRMVLVVSERKNLKPTLDEKEVKKMDVVDFRVALLQGLNLGFGNIIAPQNFVAPM